MKQENKRNYQVLFTGFTLIKNKCIFENQETEKAEVWSGTMEIDESYFGPTRVRGKRGRGAGMKTIVFGLLKRNRKVYTEIVPDVKKKTLLPIIRGKVKMEDTEINSDVKFYFFNTLVSKLNYVVIDFMRLPQCPYSSQDKYIDGNQLDFGW